MPGPAIGRRFCRTMSAPCLTPPWQAIHITIMSATPLLAEPELAPPPTARTLFFEFARMGLSGFGGVLPFVRRSVVERNRWLNDRDFVEILSLGQVLPGPNVINLAMMIGARHFGLPGALAALAGMLSAPLVVVVLLALAYTHYADNPHMAGALRGMGAVAAGLIIATGVKLVPALRNNVLWRGLCAVLGGLCFAGIALLRWPLAYVLFGLGAVGCALAWRRMAP